MTSRKVFSIILFLVLTQVGCNGTLKGPEQNYNLVKADISDRANIVLSNLIEEYPIINGRWKSEGGCIRIQSAAFGYTVGKRRDRDDIMEIGKVAVKNESKRLKQLTLAYFLGKNINMNEAAGFPALFFSGLYDKNQFNYLIYRKCMDTLTSNKKMNRGVVADTFTAAFLSIQYRAEKKPSKAYLEKARFYADKVRKSGYWGYAAFAYCSIAKASGDPNDLIIAKKIVIATLPQFFDMETSELQIKPNADCLSWHEAMISSLFDLAQLDPQGHWKEYAVKLLNYIFSDAYFDGKFIVHHINSDGTKSNKVCPGCNYAALILADRLYGDTFIIDPIKRPKKIKANLKIVKAEYGIEDKWLDVTKQVSKKVKNNCLDILASNNIAGDPLPEKKKLLRVKYRLGNEEHIKQVYEDQWFNLP